jgi:hypothetical protein
MFSCGIWSLPFSLTTELGAGAWLSNLSVEIHDLALVRLMPALSKQTSKAYCT